MKLIEDHIDCLEHLCDKYHVERMHLFGSAVSPSFRSDSDIDFLVKFKPIDLGIYFENYMAFKEEIEQLLGREIDLVEEQALRNPILIDSINRSKELVYG